MMRHQVFYGSAWSLFGTAGQQIVNLVLFVMLARLLSPADFGVMAIAAVVIDLLALAGCLGQVQALVQRKDLDPTGICTSFWMMQAFGVFCAASVYLTAPLVADAFSVPVLAEILRLLAPVCILQTLSAVPEALLQRSFGFKALAFRQVLASILGGIASIVLALQGFGVLAMVGQRLIIAAILTVAVFWSTGWRPRFLWSTAQAVVLARFGIDMVLIAFLQIANVRIIDIAVGYLFGPAILGQLRIAWKLFDFVIAVAVKPIFNVSLTFLSRLQDDRAAMGNATVRLMSVSGMILYPLFFGISIISNDVIPPVFGSKWDDAILFIQILSPIALATTINYFVDATLSASGRTRWILYGVMGQVVLAVMLTAAAASFGVVAVLGANVLRATIMAGVNIWLLNLAAYVTIAALARTQLPPILASLAMVVALSATRPLLLEFLDQGLLRAAAMSIVGALVYAAFLYFVFPAWRLTMIAEVRSLLSGRTTTPQ